MELKNLHSRKDFIKIYEFGSNSAGGIGANDGFANNAKLKDTYLGKLINGFFSGIGWLWRKSKENYLINRLSANLINELMRGVILFCFDNNINIKTGKKQGQAEAGEGESKNSNVEGKAKVEELPKLDLSPMINDVNGINLSNFDPDDLTPEVKDLLKKEKINIDFDMYNDIDTEDIEPSKYQNLEKNLHDFLQDNIKNYNSFKDDDKIKFKLIYINFRLINNLTEKLEQHEDAVVTAESLLIEDNLIRNVGQNLAHSSGSVRVKPEESQAGKVGLGKSIAMKAGVSANVGNILTPRDRKQFADTESLFDDEEESEDKKIKKDNEFKLDIHDVNLAEIETTVQSMKGDALVRVSNRVNVENLKLIQLSAKELFYDKDGNNKKSQLNWDKEVTKIYAGFTRIMDISKVDIRETNFGSELGGKVETDAKNYSGMLGNEKKVNTVADDLGKLISQNETKLSNLNGDWSFYSFSYNGTLYLGSIAPVDGVKNDFYLFMITNTFIIDDTTKKVTSNKKQFDSIFRMSTGGGIPPGDTVNIYFLLKKEANFPTGSSKTKKNTIAVLNNHINHSKGIDDIYLCKPSGGKFSTGINLKNGIKSINTKEYKTQIDTYTCRKFESLDDNWTQTLNFDSSPNSEKFCAFYNKKMPNVLKNNQDILDYLDAISKELKQ